MNNFLKRDAVSEKILKFLLFFSPEHALTKFICDAENLSNQTVIQIILTLHL